jgi:hypothetical protein
MAKPNDSIPPPGTPVTYQINRVNGQLKLANTVATGTASVSVPGKFAGVDYVEAVATVGNTAHTSTTVQLMEQRQACELHDAQS